jgi:3-oxoacyl-[acyl-carrier protein] reductase
VLVLAEWLRGECIGGNKPLDVSILLPGGVYTGMTADGLGPDPDKWPAAMGIIRPEVAAAIALNGLDEGLFYIPTHRHLGDDIEPRYRGIKDAISRLGL